MRLSGLLLSREQMFKDSFQQKCIFWSTHKRGARELGDAGSWISSLCMIRRANP